MKCLLPFLLLSLTLMGDDAPRALISSTFVGSVDSLGTRLGQTNLTVIYFDTTADDQFVPVASVRSDVTFLIKSVSGTAAPELFAKAIGKGLADKYPQIAGLTVDVYTNFDQQGNPGYTSTLTRLAPDLTPVLKAAVTQKLEQEAARSRNVQSRIVR